METRGNYVLIGLFTIAAIVAAVVFFLAFARVELDREFSYYDVQFNSVAGLGEASDVRFAGLPVGQVVDISLSPNRDGTVIVRVEVAAETPVREDSVATVETQGVTGVGFVSITAGTERGALTAPPRGEIGTINAGRSVIQSLSEDAPALVSETLTLVRDLGDLFSGDNRDRISQIIVNTETASAAFAATLEDFANVASSVDDFVVQIDRFNTVLQVLAADLDTALVTADATLSAWGSVATDAEEFLETGTDAFTTADSALTAAQSLIEADLARAASELETTIAALRVEISTLTTSAGEMVDTFGQTGTLANARLTEVAETLDALDVLIENTNVAMSTVETAAIDFSILVTEDGAALVAETRAVIAATADAVEAIRIEAETTLPTILDDVADAAETVSNLAAEVSEDFTGATGRMNSLASSANAALLQAAETFSNADETLAAINAALATGEETLAAATSAFVSAEGAIEEELGLVIARLSSTLDGLDIAVAQVSADLPGISTSLAEASSAAESAFEGISDAVRTASPAVQEFAASGLPEYAQFARDARALTQSLDRLIRQIERDPARFFLGSNTPEYRR
ncbi:MAG: MlaD family protein [Pseudomonadota bacterium]